MTTYHFTHPTCRRFYRRSVIGRVHHTIKGHEQVNSSYFGVYWREAGKWHYFSCVADNHQQAVKYARLFYKGYKPPPRAVCEYLFRFPREHCGEW